MAIFTTLPLMPSDNNQLHQHCRGGMFGMVDDIAEGPQRTRAGQLVEDEDAFHRYLRRNKIGNKRKRVENDCEQPPSGIQRRVAATSLGYLVVSPGLTTEENSVSLWHGRGQKFAVDFGEGSEGFQVPEAALKASFEYFQRMLESEANFTERGNHSITLESPVDANSFGVLITWLQTGMLLLPLDPVDAMRTCISTVVVADYLQMVNTETYIAAVENLMRKTLQGCLKALTEEHLHGIDNSPWVFETKARSIRTVAAQAAVPPFMTTHLQSDPDPAGTQAQHWQLTISHYQHLMDTSIQFAQDVMAEVRKTLLAGQRKDFHILRSRVTFCGGTARYFLFDLVRYPDPLLTNALGEINHYFTI